MMLVLMFNIKILTFRDVRVKYTVLTVTITGDVGLNLNLSKRHKEKFFSHKIKV